MNYGKHTIPLANEIVTQKMYTNIHAQSILDEKKKITNKHSRTYTNIYTTLQIKKNVSKYQERERKRCYLA